MITGVTCGPAAVLILLAAGCATDPSELPQDPQAAYEPPSDPGTGQAFLERMSGDWSVVKTFYSRTGEASVTDGTCRQEMIQGGRFLESSFEFQQGDETTTGKGIIGYDPEADTFTSFWIDSRSTRISIRQSRSAFDGARIELFGVSLAGSQPRESRTETVIGDGGRNLLHRQWAIPAGGDQRLVMELQMTRM